MISLSTLVHGPTGALALVSAAFAARARWSMRRSEALLRHVELLNAVRDARVQSRFDDAWALMDAALSERLPAEVRDAALQSRERLALDWLAVLQRRGRRGAAPAERAVAARRIAPVLWAAAAEAPADRRSDLLAAAGSAERILDGEPR